MSQPSSIKFDITLTTDVVREYFEGKAKVEAAKNKNVTDWASVVKALYAFTSEGSKPTESKSEVDDIVGIISGCCLDIPKDTSSTKKDTSKLTSDITKIVDFFNTHKSDFPKNKEELSKQVKIKISNISPEMSDVIKQLGSVFELLQDATKCKCGDDCKCGTDCKCEDECKGEECKGDECKTECKEDVCKGDVCKKEDSILEEMVKSDKGSEENEGAISAVQNMMKGIKLDDVQQGEDMSNAMEKAFASVKDQLKNVEGGEQMNEQLSKMMGENGGLGDMMKMMGPMMENMMKGLGQIQQPKKKPTYTEEGEDTVS
jgi:hypothetical protein